MADIPSSHPDHGKLLPLQFTANEKRYDDIAICDGHVLRTQEWSSYRDKRESIRLQTSSFAWALEHLRPGGTIIALLHKVEMWRMACFLQKILSFSEVQVYKPKSGHITRSLFYMAAKQVQSDSRQALEAIQAWRDLWHVATFGTDEELFKASSESGPPAEQLLDEFGAQLVRLGRSV